MIELLLWILFGGVSGWIGYLVTRADDEQEITPYLVTGTLGAVIGGFATRNLGGGEDFTVNTTSLFISLATAVVCVLIISFFGRANAN